MTSTHQAGQPAVANMSLGGGSSQALDDAVRRSIADGVTYAVAAGNSNDDACHYSPAETPEAITVGATTNTDARASFSNWGTCVDIFAPAQDITSSWNTNDTATNTISGTSMATPHVVGAAAVYLQTNPSATPAAVATYLTSQGTPGVVGSPGSGSPNVLLYSPPSSTPDPNPSPTPSPTPSPSPSPSPSPTPSPGCGQASGDSLSGTGDSKIEPSGSWYTSRAGTHKACLSGPNGVDFDLYLYRWSGSYWYVVASSLGATASETLTFNGPDGTYQWEVYSYRGSGSYTFELTKPG